MRELQVLDNGHLKLDFGEWKEFLEIEMAEQLRSQLKALIEQALEAECDFHLPLNSRFGWFRYSGPTRHARPLEAGCAATRNEGYPDNLAER
jgi:hypothetical protein